MSQWNTLSVPLEGGWQCTLVPVSDYRSPSDEWLVFTKGDEREQIEQDRRDFDRYFRPRLDSRTVSGGAALREIQLFLRDTLNVAHWNRPTDNASVEHMLRAAVANGRLVPVVNRDGRSLGRVFRPTPAPLRWPSGGSGFGGGGQKWAAFAAAGPGPLFFNGEPVLSGPYDPATQEARLSAARSAMAALTPLGDAQPFEYTPDAVSGDIEELAASTNNPNYAAKMLGYDRNTFGEMIHTMKDGLNLGGADNVIWHDNGDIEFNKSIIGNMHDY